ncbi:MAG TPA: carbohydrate binding domain-containing protein [Terriglobales bacterium]|nr:carbohydrate binding domain-containing protein [Terriglobales bacterium]
MRIQLNQATKRWLVIGAACALAAAYVALAGAQFAAAFLGTRPDLASLRRAVWLEPGNAEYRFRVGRYLRLVDRDEQAAASSYRAAVSLNPHEARYWFDLAATYELLGNADGRKDALTHAIGADPTTPEAAWQAANFYIVQGDTARAMQELRVVLANDPYLPAVALPLCWRIEPDIDALLQDVIPPMASVYSPFIEYLVAHKEMAAANKVWGRLAALHEPVERRYIFAYVRSLLLDKEVDQAKMVWRQAATLSDLSAYEPTSSNLVVNGSFSLDILNGGFDWFYDRSPQVGLLLDPTQAHLGSRSLLISFDAQTINDAGIRQVVPVEPNTGYEFSSYYRAQDIEGAGGLRFAVQDVFDGTTFFASDDLEDVDFWKQITGDFITGPQTKLLVIHVQRVPPGPIKGKLWIDGVQLAPKTVQKTAPQKPPAPPAPASPAPSQPAQG